MSRPRIYQQDAIASIISKFTAETRRLLAVMATGTGKTHVAAGVTQHFLPMGRIMFMAHRDELIMQGVRKFRAITGIEPAIEKAELYSDENGFYGKPPIVFTSVQTMNSCPKVDWEKPEAERRYRMKRFDPSDFALTIFDEAHHAVSESWMRVQNHFLANPNVVSLFLTATPDRADGIAMGNVCDAVAYRYDLDNAVRDGYLVKPRQRRVIIEGLDFSKVRTNAGDLDQSDLEAAMMAERPLHGMAHATIEVACGLKHESLRQIQDSPDRVEILQDWLRDKRRRKTLIFAPSVAYAKRLAEIINRWIPNSADYVAGVAGEHGMSMDKRRANFAAFTRGELKFLTNFEVAGEGYDEPSIEVVVPKPTKSRAKYTQEVGRGTRPLEEIAHALGDLSDAYGRRAMIESSLKPFCEVLDFCGNSGKHQLVGLVDILGGEMFDPEVIARANANAAEVDAAVDTDEQLAKAQAELEAARKPLQDEAEELLAELAREGLERERLDIARRASLVATSTYHVEDVDAFDPMARMEPNRVTPVIGGASEKQVELLVKLGVRRDTAMGYSVRQAGAIITNLKQKRCTTGQRSYLMRLGYSSMEIDGMNFDAASHAIEQAKAGAAA